MEEQLPQEETQPSSQARPAARFNGSGGIQVAVWKEKSEQGYDRYSVRADRVYKDEKSDEFKNTNYFRDTDLLRLGQLIEEADRWIEQDKGKLKLVSNQAAAR